MMAAMTRGRRVLTWGLGYTLLVPVVIMVATTITAGQQPEPTKANGTGLIAGRVVDAVAGQPLADASVQISAGSPTWARRDVSSDAQGRFEIRDMPAGTFLLSARKTGYGYQTSYGSRFPDDAAIQWFDLADGEAARDITLRVWRFASVSGRVVDAAGAPVYGVGVQACRIAVVAGRRLLEPGRSASTDRDGVYHLSGLFPSRFLIAVPSVPMDATPAFGGTGAVQATLGHPTMYFPGVISPTDATALTLAAGEDRTDVNIRRPALTAVSVSGTIDALVPGQRLWPTAELMPADLSDPATDLPVTSTSLAPDGRFRFPRVPPGRYVIRVVQFPPGNGTMMQTSTGATGFGWFGMNLAPMLPDPTRYAEMGVVVADRDIDNLQVATRPGARIRGRLVFEGSGQKPDSARLPSAAIVIERADRRLSAFQMARIETDGTFTTVGLPPGKYQLRPFPAPQLGQGSQKSPPAWGEEWAETSETMHGRPVLNEVIDLGTEDAAGLTITMSDNRMELAGAIRDASGRLRPDASIYLFPTDRQAWTGAGGFGAAELREIRPNRLGVYRATMWRPGEYYIVAAVAGARPDWREASFLDGLAASAVVVPLASGDKRVLDLAIVR
jgi:hypothetical protein